MTPPRRIIGTIAALTLTLGLLTPASPAHAAHVSCGQVLHVSTTLDADLFCPSGHGLVLAGDNLVLNLNGHTIAGQLVSRTVIQAGANGDDGVVGSPYTVRYAADQYAGIRVQGSQNRILGPGTVRSFAAGVVVEGGNSNTVMNLRVEDNIGPPGTDFLGDGIMIVEGDGNRIVANHVRNNGPFDGIVLLGATNHNQIHGNTVVDNRVPEICPERDIFEFSAGAGGTVHRCGPTHPTRGPFTFWNQQNMGIKIEGQGPGGTAAHFNTITSNIVTGSGNTGIIVTTNCPDFGQPGFVCEAESPSDNTITNNRANGNGFGYPAGLPALRVFNGPSNGGDGIILLLGGPHPPVRHTVSGNTANGNSQHGIGTRFGASGNPNTASRFFGNTALFNNAAPVEGGAPSYNGIDSAALIGQACDANSWSRNNFGSSPAHIIGPVPPNNLTNHPCVGPQIPVGAQRAASPAAEGSGDAWVWRWRPAAAPPR